jgi:hypothetical protein
VTASAVSANTVTGKNAKSIKTTSKMHTVRFKPFFIKNPPVSFLCLFVLNYSKEYGIINKTYCKRRQNIKP